MDTFDPDKNRPPRAGENYRFNQQRYFHVMSQGWYIHTREGVHGPYLRKEDAHDQLEMHILHSTPDPSDSWRMG